MRLWGREAHDWMESRGDEGGLARLWGGGTRLNGIRNCDEDGLMIEDGAHGWIGCDEGEL